MSHELYKNKSTTHLLPVGVLPATWNVSSRVTYKCEGCDVRNMTHKAGGVERRTHTKNKNKRMKEKREKSGRKVTLGL